MPASPLRLRDLAVLVALCSFCVSSCSSSSSSLSSSSSHSPPSVSSSYHSNSALESKPSRAVDAEQERARTRPLHTRAPTFQHVSSPAAVGQGDDKGRPEKEKEEEEEEEQRLLLLLPRQQQNTEVNATLVRLNIHLALSAPIAEAASGYCEFVTKHGAPHNDIDLTNVSMPHISLYLTAFMADDLPRILRGVATVAKRFEKFRGTTRVQANRPPAAIKTNSQFSLQEHQQGSRRSPPSSLDTLAGMHPCSVSLPAQTLVQGAYGMWDVTNDACLQLLTDEVVNATYEFIIPNQPIPPWVNDLPEPERSKKIAMIKKYGSPNVFSQFQPHVTLAFDAVESLTPAFAKLAVEAQSFRAAEIVVSLVGPHGTVPRNGTVARFPITDHWWG